MDMKSEFNYQSVPHNFAHCFNGQCARAGECLRYFVGERIPADCNYVTAVNPNKVALEEKSCPFFKEKRLVRMAIGMSHLYDNLTYRDAIAVKRPIYSHFGRSTYYRMRNSERLITPEEQAFIKKAFQACGITSEPVFDAYEDDYVWE